VLFGIVVVGSIAAFTQFGRMRDSLCHRYVEGCHIEYYEDTDDAGRPTTGSSISTAHWYSRVGLWVFEWVVMLAVVILPGITWYACTEVVKKASAES
jgi:hypothetical protein